MATVPAVTTEELELEQAELLPSKETPLLPAVLRTIGERLRQHLPVDG
jgi:hypothetical protein